MKSVLSCHSRLKRIALGAILVLATPLAFAAPPSEEQMDRLLEVVRVRALIEQMLPQVEAEQEQVFEQLMQGHSIDDEQRARLKRVADKGNQAMKRVLAWENMRPLYHDIYGSTFTAEEIQALTELYSTPTGQMILDRMPQLMQKSMAVIQQMLIPVIQGMQGELMEELNASPGAGPADNVLYTPAQAAPVR